MWAERTSLWGLGDLGAPYRTSFWGFLLLWRSFLRHACGIHIHNTSLGLSCSLLTLPFDLFSFLASFLEVAVSLTEQTSALHSVSWTFFFFPFGEACLYLHRIYRHLGAQRTDKQLKSQFFVYFLY